MGHSSQPFIYSGLDGGSGSQWRFPVAVFDPKAVTRASWQPKPAKPRPRGPLISLDHHPDAFALPSYRPRGGVELSRASRWAIKWLRRVQLVLRMLELGAAAAVLVLMALVVNMETVTMWTLRIAPGLSVMHCCYAIWHLSRTASGRTPASSAAYHAFAIVMDLGLLSVYVFGVLLLRNKLHKPVATSLSDQSLAAVFISAVYYTLIGAASLQLLSFSISLWLSFVFHRISLLPPDMNPLERRLTARPMHKKKLSTTTISSSSSNEHGGDLSYSSSLPFIHTRAGYDDSDVYRQTASGVPTNLSNIWRAHDRYMAAAEPWKGDAATNDYPPSWPLLEQDNEGQFKMHPDPLRVHPPPAEKRDGMESLMSTPQTKSYNWHSNVSVTDEVSGMTHQKQPWYGVSESSRGQRALSTPKRGSLISNAHGQHLDSEASPLQHAIVGTSSRLSSGSDYPARRSTSIFASAVAPERRRVSGRNTAT
ncbi:hypothetical protein CDD81_4952 [Ophiocordyceps australis]|uniref:Uncharacterized protein n=1 Tax=Ophiocordyceps australis TaxID=1399860 RepID=A0A2C5XN52_9HYPO|nr:hypothetical protein CDD81_4952 [Ophiocordyceps australis]